MEYFNSTKIQNKFVLNNVNQLKNIDNEKNINSSFNDINSMQIDNDGNIMTENENNEDISTSNEENFHRYMEDDFNQKQKDLMSLVFDGYITSEIVYRGLHIRLHILTDKETDEAFHQASFYDDESMQAAIRLLILSKSIEGINEHNFLSSDECYEYLSSLPLIMIFDLYEEYRSRLLYQNSLIQDINNFYDLINNDFCRIKYKVMRAFGVLPTEERCHKMNDGQWLWMYYNLEEDMIEKQDRIQDNLDYIGVYVNPKMAKEMFKHNTANKRKRDEQRKRRYKQFAQQNSNTKKKPQKATEVLDNYYQHTDNSEATKVNDSFEQELAKAIGKETQVTEISDDNEAGNPYESEEEFQERVMAFAQFAGTSYGYTKPKKVKVDLNKGKRFSEEQKLKQQIEREKAKGIDTSFVKNDLDDFIVQSKNQVSPKRVNRKGEEVDENGIPLYVIKKLQDEHKARMANLGRIPALMNQKEPANTVNKHQQANLPIIINDKKEEIDQYEIQLAKEKRKQDQEFMKKMHIRSMDDVPVNTINEDDIPSNVPDNLDFIFDDDE